MEANKKWEISETFRGRCFQIKKDPPPPLPNACVFRREGGGFGRPKTLETAPWRPLELEREKEGIQHRRKGLLLGGSYFGF